jgi:hypothetical protein
VGTVVSATTLAALRVPVRPTAVPRNTVYRIRICANRDLSEVLHRLTEHDVQVLEIRRCAEPSRPGRRAAPAPSQETGDLPATAVGVVVPFRLRTRPSPSGAGPAPDGRSSREPGFDPGEDGSAG